MHESLAGEHTAWLLDEMAHAGPEHLDEAFVAGFDRKQGYPGPDEDIAVFTGHGLGRDSVVVDLGAGTGQFALAAAWHFGRVIAVDVSRAMGNAMRSKADAVSAPVPALEYVQGGFLSYSPAAPVDGVFTRHALHQIPDFWKAIALARIAAMLKPGGCCGCGTWSTTSSRTRPQQVFTGSARVRRDEPG